LGPDGRVIGEPLIDDEGIVYAEIDLSRCIQPRQMHDIVGHYNRFDVFDLRVNRRPLQAARYDDLAESGAAELDADFEPLPEARG
jgi:aliphatic nitrilase